MSHGQSEGPSQRSYEQVPQQVQNFDRPFGPKKPAKSGNHGQKINIEQLSISQMQAWTQGYDELYLEALEGFVGIRRTPGERAESGQLEMLTLLDLSAVLEIKHQQAHELAQQLQQVRHENVLNFLAPMKLVHTHLQDGMMMFVTEAPDHQLSWRHFCTLPVDLEQVVSIFRQLTTGLQAIHGQGLVMRDLHPTRIHLKEGIIKWNLIGTPFNFKKLLRSHKYTGHLNYTAPECLYNDAQDNLTQKADIWALGCCLYFLVTKRDPFNSSDPDNNQNFVIKKNIRKGLIDMPEDKDLDQNGQPRHKIVQRLLDVCLAAKLNKRPNATELLNIIDREIVANVPLLRGIQESKKDAQMALADKIKCQMTNGVDQSQVSAQHRAKEVSYFFMDRNEQDPSFIQMLDMDDIVKNHSIEINLAPGIFKHIQRYAGSKMDWEQTENVQVSPATQQESNSSDAQIEESKVDISMQNTRQSRPLSLFRKGVQNSNNVSQNSQFSKNQGRVSKSIERHWTGSLAAQVTPSKGDYDDESAGRSSLWRKVNLMVDSLCNSSNNGSQAAAKIRSQSISSERETAYLTGEINQDDFDRMDIEALFWQLLNESQSFWGEPISYSDAALGVQGTVQTKQIEGFASDWFNDTCVISNQTLANYHKAALQEGDYYQRVFPRLQSLTIISRKEHTWYHLMHWTLPMFMTDREILCKITYKQISPTKKLYLTNTTNHPLYPPHQDRVRMKFIQIALVEQNGNDLHLTQIGMSDLMGGLPKSLFNMIRKRIRSEDTVSLVKVLNLIKAEQ